MSACRTCELTQRLSRDMPQRVVAYVDGVTHIQELKAGQEAEGLLKAAKFLMVLAEQKANPETPPHG